MLDSIVFRIFAAWTLKKKKMAWLIFILGNILSGVFFSCEEYGWTIISLAVAWIVLTIHLVRVAWKSGTPPPSDSDSTPESTPCLFIFD